MKEGVGSSYFTLVLASRTRFLRISIRMETTLAALTYIYSSTEMFAKNNNVQFIPPTRAALEAYKRATYQGGHLWGQKLVPNPDLPSHWLVTTYTKHTGRTYPRHQSRVMSWFRKVHTRRFEALHSQKV